MSRNGHLFGLLIYKLMSHLASAIPIVILNTPLCAGKTASLAAGYSEKRFHKVLS